MPFFDDEATLLGKGDDTGKRIDVIYLVSMLITPFRCPVGLVGHGKGRVEGSGS